MRYCFALIIAIFLSSTSRTLDAQVRVSINFNVDSQPIWGPTGHDYVEYYYLPDIEVYYSVPQHRYYYNKGGRWISSSYLPSRFHNYDLYHSYKVVVNEREPWRNNEIYRTKYSSYRGRHDQQPIRDSRDSKYFVNKNHPEHKTWLRQQHQESGKHNGSNKGNDGKAGKRDTRGKNDRGN